MFDVSSAICIKVMSEHKYSRFIKDSKDINKISLFTNHPSDIFTSILWKKAQKIAKKNKPSDTINKATPKLIPR